jgi:hypothetical protein
LTAAAREVPDWVRLKAEARGDYGHRWLAGLAGRHILSMADEWLDT